MTSPATDAETRRHFKANSFFGLKEAQVCFFSQGALPALTEGGRIIRESPSRLAMAPDGNGGVYMALRGAGVLADMAAHGVEAVDCYCVDNALVRLGDPLFTGFCHSRGIECGECPPGKVSAAGASRSLRGVVAVCMRLLHVWEEGECTRCRHARHMLGADEGRQVKRARQSQQPCTVPLASLACHQPPAPCPALPCRQTRRHPFAATIPMSWHLCCC